MYIVLYIFILYFINVSHFRYLLVGKQQIGILNKICKVHQDWWKVVDLPGMPEMIATFIFVSNFFFFAFCFPADNVHKHICIILAFCPFAADNNCSEAKIPCQPLLDKERGKEPEIF